MSSSFINVLMPSTHGADAQMECNILSSIRTSRMKKELEHI